jgi:hypothetical protein
VFSRLFFRFFFSFHSDMMGEEQQVPQS